MVSAAEEPDHWFEEIVLLVQRRRRALVRAEGHELPEWKLVAVEVDGKPAYVYERWVLRPQGGRVREWRSCGWYPPICEDKGLCGPGHVIGAAR